VITRTIPDHELSSELRRLKSLPFEDQKAEGYGHTLNEICQQPELWMATAKQISGHLDRLAASVLAARGIVFTGSGSSHYVGESIAYAVREGTGLPAAARPSGELILFGEGALPPERPLLLVSFARSGNSPESSALIRNLLETEPEVHHLILTCNRAGRLAEDWAGDGSDPRVHVITLDDRSCDRSLVMTSSFTNLALAGLGLALIGDASRYLANAQRLSSLCQELFSKWADPLARAADWKFDRMIALGAALKMLEMTGGRVMTMAETSLGFRHGPMCALQPDTLLVFFLSPDPLRRTYQMDLLTEIQRKKLGGRKVVVGCEIPREALADGDMALELPQLCHLADDWAGLLHVVVGQLLGFFRCRAEGLKPDEPADNGAISRVVTEFPMYGAPAKVPL
jgi:tagatose-6-phosphate ketose/aldose isomerase